MKTLLNNMEIVIVDDFSNDTILTKFLININKLPNVNILMHSRNMGAFNAKLHGFRAAKGDYIMSCDDDDLPDEEYYIEMIRNFDDENKIFIAINSVIGKLTISDINALIQKFHNLVNIAFKKELISDIAYPINKRIIRDDAPLVIPIYLKAKFKNIKFYNNYHQYRFNTECKHEHQYTLTHQKINEKEIKNGYDFLMDFIKNSNFSNFEEAIGLAYKSYIDIV